MLGAITGDIVGSTFEFSNYRAKDFQPLFQIGSKFTDDTICTIAIADALLNQRPPAEALKDWGRLYWSNGGWGQRFARWLASPDSEPYNSYGNGAAMRVSSCGWLADSFDQALQLALTVTEVTHNHPEGIKGAQATAAAIFMARQHATPEDIAAEIVARFEYKLDRTIDEIRANNPHSEACQQTVPEAITCALAATSFEDAIRNAISIGGDSDTIAAIAGSIAEPMFGIPEEIQTQTRSLLPSDIIGIVDQFYDTLSAP